MASSRASFFFFLSWPGGASGKEPACQCSRCKRCRFNPWVGKIPWRRARKLSWWILCIEEPGSLRSIGFQKVGHNWNNLAHTYRVKATQHLVKKRVHPTLWEPTVWVRSLSCTQTTITEKSTVSHQSSFQTRSAGALCSTIGFAAAEARVEFSLQEAQSDLCQAA